jgi:hypothetical protein
MNRKRFLGTALAVLVCSTLSFGQTTSKQCTATTKKNVQCKNVVKKGDLCYLHDPFYVKKTKTTTKVCSGTTKNNKKCKNKTKNKSGLCHFHNKKD